MTDVAPTEPLENVRKALNFPWDGGDEEYIGLVLGERKGLWAWALTDMTGDGTSYKLVVLSAVEDSGFRCSSQIWTEVLVYISFFARPVRREL